MIFSKYSILNINKVKIIFYRLGFGPLVPDGHVSMPVPWSELRKLGFVVCCQSNLENDRVRWKKIAIYVSFANLQYLGSNLTC